jgi:hypothetical protein
MNVCLYGVVDRSVEFPDEVVGIGGRPVQLVGYREVDALFSRFEGDWVDTTRANLSTHSQVVEAAMHHGTVLPVRFGVLFHDRDAVVDDFLKPNHAHFSRLLHQLAGCMEFRVQARYLPDVVVREAVSHHPAIGRLQARVRGRPTDATYYDRIRLGEKVVQIVDAIKVRDAGELLAVLAANALEHRVLPAKSEVLALNAAFLVDGRRRLRFDHAISRLASEQESRMAVRVVGPLPPWDFVDLHVGAATG